MLFILQCATILTSFPIQHHPPNVYRKAEIRIVALEKKIVKV